MYKKRLLFILVLLIISLSITGCSQDIDHTDPIDVLNGYLSADNWEERLPYVKKTDDIEELMKTYYGSRNLNLNYKINNESKKNIDDNMISIETNIDDHYTTYFLEKTDGNYKIRWKNLVGYNKIPWNTFKAQNPSSPRNFRVYAIFDDYYNYYFRDKEITHYSIQLRESQWDHNIDQVISLHGYIRKNSEKGKRLFDILKDGRRHPITVKIKPPYDKSGDVYHILDFKYDWIVDLEEF